MGPPLHPDPEPAAPGPAPTSTAIDPRTFTAADFYPINAAPPELAPTPTYTAADFFLALATTPPRAGLAKWQQWVLGIAVLAGLTFAFVWPLIQERRARLELEHLAQPVRQSERLPAPAPFAPTFAGPYGFQRWPLGALGGVPRPQQKPWWCL